MSTSKAKHQAQNQRHVKNITLLIPCSFARVQNAPFATFVSLTTSFLNMVIRIFSKQSPRSTFRSLLETQTRTLWSTTSSAMQSERATSVLDQQPGTFTYPWGWRCMGVKVTLHFPHQSLPTTFFQFSFIPVKNYHVWPQNRKRRPPTVEILHFLITLKFSSHS